MDNLVKILSNLRLMDPTIYTRLINKEDIKLALKALDDRRTMESINKKPVEKKNSKSAKIFRLNGNEAFEKNESLDEALEEYTKSVAYAPSGSRELAFAYANRSALFLKTHLFSDCLLDIKRALRSNYPDYLKAKLFLRKAICIRAMNPKDLHQLVDVLLQVRKWLGKMSKKNQEVIIEKMKMIQINNAGEKLFQKDWIEIELKLTSEHPNLPGVSDSVRLNYSEEFGRHMVATRDIRPGEVIIMQKPYAQVVVPRMRYKVCWDCGKQTWSSVPCKNCVYVIFCSEECRKKGNLNHHDLECEIIKTIAANLKSLAGSASLTMRIITMALKEANNSFQTLLSNVAEYEAEIDPLKKGFTDDIIDPTKFTSFYGMKDNSKSSSVTVHMGTLTFSLFTAYFMATRSNFLGKKLSTDLRILKNNNEFIDLIELMVKIFGRYLLNGFQIGKSLSPHFDNIRMIECVTSASGLFNHSCNANAFRSFFRDFAVIQARYPIKKNEQVFLNWGKSWCTEPKELRQKEFQNMFQYKCQCEACVNNWPIDPVDTPIQFIDTTHIAQMFMKFALSFENEYSIEDPLSEKRKRWPNLLKEMETIINFIEYCDCIVARNDKIFFSAVLTLNEFFAFCGDQFLSLEQFPN